MRLGLLRLAGSALATRGGRQSHSASRAAPRILLIRPDHIGDVVLSSPAVEALRVSLREAYLTMMVGPWSEDVARRDPMLDAVLSFPFPGFTRAPKGSVIAPYQVLWMVARILRRGEYDAAVVLRDDHWWGALAASLAGIPVRIGYAIAECRPFLTHPVQPAQMTHWAERSLRLAHETARMLGRPETNVSGRLGLRFGARSEDEAELASALAGTGIDETTPVVVMHPGTGAPLKLWPEENWVEVGNCLARRGVAVAITGSKSEADLADRIAAGIPGAKPIAGRVELGGLAALLKRSALAVGTDNGPMHMAVAIDTPSVRLYGPTDPTVYGPWGDPQRHIALSAPGVPHCGRLDLSPSNGTSPTCMRAISADQVIAACLDLLDKWGVGPDSLGSIPNLPLPLGEGSSAGVAT